MGRKRKPEVQEQPPVNLSVDRNGPRPGGAVARRIAERGAADAARLAEPITAEEIAQAKKATTMMRVSQHFNQKLKAVSQLAGMTMVEFCDTHLIGTLDSMHFELAEKAVNATEAELKSRLDYLRNLKGTGEQG